MTDMMNNGYDSMMGGLWIFSILFWVLIIAGVIFIVKWSLERNNKIPPVNGPALDILKKRYARGEIDRETFEQMKKEIEP